MVVERRRYVKDNVNDMMDEVVMSRRESAAMHRETSARLRNIEDKVTPSRAGPGSKGSLNYLVKSKHFSVPLGAGVELADSFDERIATFLKSNTAFGLVRDNLGKLIGQTINDCDRDLRPDDKSIVDVITAVGLMCGDVRHTVYVTY